MTVITTISVVHIIGIGHSITKIIPIRPKIRTVTTSRYRLICHRHFSTDSVVHDGLEVGTYTGIACIDGLDEIISEDTRLGRNEKVSQTVFDHSIVWSTVSVLFFESFSDRFVFLMIFGIVFFFLFEDLFRYGRVSDMV